MKSAGIVFVILVYILLAVAALVGLVGYYLNIADLISMVVHHSDQTGLELLRTLGVVIGPLGSILGLFV